MERASRIRPGETYDTLPQEQKERTLRAIDAQQFDFCCLVFFAVASAAYVE